MSYRFQAPADLNRKDGFRTVNRIAAVLFVVILGVVLRSWMATSQFRTERATVIHAPAANVFARINNLRRWSEWSPYDKKQPQMTRSYGRIEEGKGAVYLWEGTRSVGKGRMEIVESVPPSTLRIRLDFEQPFEGHNMLTFVLSPEGDSTRVTWTMTGEQSFLVRLMNRFVDMDVILGNDFEAALGTLKQAIENPPPPAKVAATPPAPS